MQTHANPCKPAQPADVQSVMRSDLPNDTLVYDRTGTVLLADLSQPGLTGPGKRRAAEDWLPASASGSPLAPEKI